jgi:hypothetical protein
MKKLLFLFVMVTPLFVNAQNTMYFMDRLPQNIAYNPAFIPEVKFHVGLPGASVQAYNSGFTYKGIENFVDNVWNDQYDADGFINSIGDYNQLNAEAKANLLSIGFKLKEKGYFSVNLTANNFSALKASSEIGYVLADLDDLSEEDFPLVIDDLSLATNSYLTLGFTYSRVINEHLTLGVSPRINFNVIGLDASNLGYKIELEEDEFGRDYSTTISGDVKLGLPVEINPDAIDGSELDLDEDLLPAGWEDDLTLGDLLKDKSFSLDLGATYLLNKWTFSASILNLGASKWKTNGYQLDGNSETINVREASSIKIGIPTNIYLGAMRQFSPKWNYGLMYNNVNYGTGSKSSATLSLNGYVGSMLSTSVSYTAGYKYNNVGLGLRLRFLPGADLYFVTDNILQAFNYKEAYRVSAAFGINLSFGATGNFKKSELSIEESI